MSKIVGLLEAFTEPHTEGFVWSIIDNSKTGYDALVILKDGDYLFVEDGNGGIEWEGYVRLQHNTNLKPHSYSNKGHSWQRVNQCTVHKLQNNIEANVWFEWFTMNRPAVLIHHDTIDA